MKTSEVQTPGNAPEPPIVESTNSCPRNALRMTCFRRACEPSYDLAMRRLARLPGSFVGKNQPLFLVLRFFREPWRSPVFTLPSVPVPPTLILQP